MTHFCLVFIFTKLAQKKVKQLKGPQLHYTAIHFKF